MPDTPASASAADEPLLAGIVVADFTRVLAGAYCTRMMADLGATVIKMERPGEGDEVRYIPPQMDPDATDQSAYFARTGAGKRSIAIDFQNPGSREVVLDLVRSADVVVENFAPGVMAKYQFDYAHLKAVKPDIVFCSISGFGQTGPLRSLQAYAHLVNAFSGMMEMDRAGYLEPKASNLQAADVLAGLNAFGAINAALLRRFRRGVGAYIDVSMLESLVCADDLNYAGLLNGDIVPRKPRTGMVVQPIGDRYVAAQIGGTPQMWPRMCQAMNRPDLVEDPRFATGPARKTHWNELLEVVGQWLQTFPDVDAAAKALADARVPSMPMLHPEEVVQHPHLLHRQAFPVIDHPKRPQGVTVIAQPFHLDGAPVHPRASAPWRIGQHTREVLRGHLGYDDAKIDALFAQKVVAD